MNEQPESLDSAIRRELDKDNIETPPEVTFDVNAQAMERYDGWLANLKRRYPLESEDKLKRKAAELACLNRRERRRVFKHSSMKLPKLMTTIKGKR